MSNKKNIALTRKINKRYKEIKDCVVKDPEVEINFVKAEHSLKEVKECWNNLLLIDKEYNRLLEKPVKEDLFESLPVESLKDSIELDIFGETSRARYCDVEKAKKIKEKAQILDEIRKNLISKSRVDQIDLIMSKINAILKESDK